LLGEVDASINLVAAEDCDSDEDEEWWVNMVRVGGEGEDPQGLKDLELEESEEKADKYRISACIRRDNSGLEVSWSTSGMHQFHQIQTNVRRTGGGPRGLRGQAPRKRTRKKSSTSSACS
jgi:hypothetical protein